MSDQPYIFMAPGLKTALRVNARVEELWGRVVEDTDVPSGSVIIEGFSSKFVTGLHYRNIHNDRSANLTEERTCSGIAINYGRSSEYDRISNQAVGKVTRIEYGEHQVDDVAMDLIEWLIYGKEPEEREQPRAFFERTVFDSPDEVSVKNRKYTLVVRKGRLSKDCRKPKGQPITQDQVNRLTAISDRSLGEGEFITLHRQQYWMDYRGSPLDLESSQLVVYNKTTGVLYALYVRNGNFAAYCHGVYYGFPKCCIDSFCTKDQSTKGGWWIGTGLMVCKKCEDKPEQEMRDEIASRRLAQSPFPKDDMDSAEHDVHFLEMFCAGKTDPRQYML